jgi:hypothetical protein
MRATTIAALCVILFNAYLCYAQNPPFNYLKVGSDAEGFITLAEGGGPYERFFPLGTFFYPALPGVFDTTELQADYGAFASNGGNLVVAPWDPERWPNRPGAIFQDEGTCGGHLIAAKNVGVKIIADPALFWGRYGQWPDDGNIVWPAQREQRFNEMVQWVENSNAAEAFMGYYHWDRPAWRYYDSRNRLEYPRPTPTYINSATSQLKILEGQENATHKIFMAQGVPVKVQDLWKDYHAAANIVGGVVLPYPEPTMLQMANEQGTPTLGCLLPNYYSSVSGSLADAIHEAARTDTPLGARCKPYIAVLQAKDQGGVSLTEEEMFFQAYDAIIHGAKGLVWYDDNDFQEPTEYDFFYKDTNVPWYLRNLLNELSAYEINGAIKGDYDYTVVAVTTGITSPSYNVVEESTFVSGMLVPKTHFLSDQIIMEGVAKKFYEWTYLIVACRPHEGAASEYRVSFRPFFSAHDYYNPWGDGAEYETVYKHGGGAMQVWQGHGGGWWEDYFNPGEVAIYKFQTPEPWQPPTGQPGNGE